MQYQETDGVVELAHKGLTASCHSEVLIEVNSQPPGLQTDLAVAYTLGVDYRALQSFRALDDRERFTALALAFTCRAQYHCEIFIPVHREIIRVPDDFCEVVHKLPAIAPYVTEAERTDNHKQKRGAGRSRGLLVVQTRLTVLRMGIDGPVRSRLEINY
ncbi:uncharacterized protein BDW43DRAFT_259245 [Aspergillus alliaceus]|uniref:uncharacterized protein n=1 Tax=Petromyces alliaceus TaxID=209559 RepID=UPI0012A43E53|nr:uncharacterized protein BDW43DRAFT_259245 [Aspergillus alliaceus]KAB8239802.1 hypothetical protein BDW43DRAFT_259245 [Aspergillus alliaceus]